MLLTTGQVAGFTRGGQFLSLLSAQTIARQIIDTGVVRRALLGVRIVRAMVDYPPIQPNQPVAGRPAVKIEQVIKNSVAEQAGLQPCDYILSRAGEPVGKPSDFAFQLANRSGKTELVILRGNEELKINVILVQK